MTPLLPEVRAATLQVLHSPSLLIFADRVASNIDRMIQTAGVTTRLRPHCKTHKMTAVVEMLLQKGIAKHKAATIAETEMLFDTGVTDVVLAYNPVGPNIDRVVELRQRFPDTRLTVTADHSKPLTALAEAATKAAVQVGVMLDVDVGQHRTGVSPDCDEALNLYQQIHNHPGLIAAGFHVYDGHQHQESLEERSQAVLLEWPRVLQLRERCLSAGLDVPEILCGGSPTFPIYAELDEPAITLSPGTSIFHDAGYGSHFPDLQFSHAAAVVTRVISRPTETRLTLDLGNKAVAADPPDGKRVFFPDLPDAQHVIHNEEHLVLESPHAERFAPGDILLGIPTHICPTSALHHDVAVIENDTLTKWTVTARNRRITI